MELTAKESKTATRYLDKLTRLQVAHITAKNASDEKGILVTAKTLASYCKKIEHSKLCKRFETLYTIILRQSIAQAVLMAYKFRGFWDGIL